MRGRGGEIDSETMTERSGGAPGDLSARSAEERRVCRHDTESLRVRIDMITYDVDLIRGMIKGGCRAHAQQPSQAERVCPAGRPFVVGVFLRVLRGLRDR